MSAKINSETNSEMSADSKILIVKPIYVNDVTGEETFFDDEVGTPDFYMVSDTLKKYLGESWICIDKENSNLFTIEKLDKKFDNKFVYDTINTLKNREIIKNIYEINTLFPIWGYSSHIKFEIMN